MTAEERISRIVMSGSEPVPYAPDILKAMRDWIADCSWHDVPPDEVADLTEAEVIAGVRRHFGGGLDAFLLTMEVAK